MANLVYTPHSPCKKPAYVVARTRPLGFLVETPDLQGLVREVFGGFQGSEASDTSSPLLDDLQCGGVIEMLQHQ